MNKKTILSTVCALACATNIFAVQPAFAMKTVSADKQEAYAHKLAMENFSNKEPTSYSAETMRITPIIHELQQRICNKNGIGIISGKFQGPYDYETKTHLIKVVDDYDNAYSVGAGYIYIGTKHVSGNLKANKFINQFDFILCEICIAHELTHNKEGHSLEFVPLEKRELVAEKGSISLMDKLSEGGWGCYLVSMNRNLNRPEQNWQVMESFEQASNNKISIKSPSDVYYRSNGYKYPLSLTSQYSNDKDAYFGGQIAYCISKGALTLDSIQIVDNTLKNTIKFEGDYLLVCKSDKLPNGYRVLASIYGKDKDTWAQTLAEIRKYVKQDLNIRAYNVASKEWRNSDPSLFAAWLACAVAYDCQR